MLCFEKSWCSVVGTVPTLRTGRSGVQIPTVKVKVKFTLEQATKTQRGSRGIAVLFLQPRRYMGVGG